jgi:hypothetical protein
MIIHPSIQLAFARERQRDLIGQADRFRLARAVRHPATRPGLLARPRVAPRGACQPPGRIERTGESRA